MKNPFRISKIFLDLFLMFSFFVQSTIIINCFLISLHTQNQLLKRQHMFISFHVLIFLPYFFCWQIWFLFNIIIKCCVNNHHIGCVKILMAIELKQETINMPQNVLRMLKWHRAEIHTYVCTYIFFNVARTRFKLKFILTENENKLKMITLNTIKGLTKYY